MQRFDENEMALGVRRYCGVCSVVILGVLSLQPLVRAQQNEVSSLSACVPSDLAALIVPEGRAIRVSPVPELAGAQRSALGNAAKGGVDPSPSADRAASAAYKIFQREARQGRPAAMVNLAVTSLAGWGTAPNAGAALYWLHAAADRGYSPAFYNLGILYFRGCGVGQDFAEAFHFFERAARGGDLAAAVNLGYLYTRGLGVPQDHGAAAHWYRQAAETGQPQAQFSLADLYLHGEGVAQDDTAAFAWFRKAALQGHTGARIMLGSMYAAGRGTPKDLPSAYLWISAAALQGDTRGNATLLSLEAQLTPAQLAEAKLRAPSLAVDTARTGRQESDTQKRREGHPAGRRKDQKRGSEDPPLQGGSANHLCPRDIARLIEERIDALEEANGMGQFRVGLECGFVHPTRMNVEEPAVPHRTKGMETQAAGLLAGWPCDAA